MIQDKYNFIVITPRTHLEAAQMVLFGLDIKWKVNPNEFRKCSMYPEIVLYINKDNKIISFSSYTYYKRSVKHNNLRELNLVEKLNQYE